MNALLIFGLALSLTEVANSQAGNMPSCVSSCITNAFAASECTFMGLQNWPCACSVSSFQSSVNSCFDNSCSADDASIGKNQVDIECSNAISSSIPPPFSSPTSPVTTTTGTETSNSTPSTSTSTVVTGSTATSSGTAATSSSQSESASETNAPAGPLTPPIPPTSTTPGTSSQAQSSSPAASVTSEGSGSTPTSPLTGVASSTSGNSVGSISPISSSSSSSISRPGATTITSTLSSGTIPPSNTTTLPNHAAEAYGSKSLKAVVVPLLVALTYLG